MFYSRPDIEPLGLDLTEFHDIGAFYFAGKTVDGRTVQVKYRSSWLHVWVIEPGMELNYNQPVILKQIGPPFHSGMLPEQICDILGLTVNGQKPLLTEERRLKESEYERILDWSGKITYWESWHFLFDDELSKLIDDITKAFSDHCLVQSGWIGEERRWRKISFHRSSDNDLTIGIGFDPSRLEKMLSSSHVTHQEANEIFRHKIDISCMDFQDRRHNTSSRKFLNEHGADKLDLKYELQNPRQFPIATSFVTDDPKGVVYIEKLISILDKHFFSGRQMIDLQTKEVIEERMAEGLVSYSMSQRDWCLKNPDRYLSVGVKTPISHSLKGDKALGKGDKPLFYGIRPL